MYQIRTSVSMIKPNDLSASAEFGITANESGSQVKYLRHDRSLLGLTEFLESMMIKGELAMRRRSRR